MPRYVALLRGINVGGKNMIRMADLKAVFEENGYGNVATYIASGNVLFDSGDRSSAKLTKRIEDMLAARFGHYKAWVVLRTREQMRRTVDGAPKGFGSQPARYRYDAIFLKSPLTPATVVRAVPLKEGVDRVYAGKGVVYHSRLTSRATQSRLSRVASMPIYQNMTIRNWNTTVKLREIMESE